MAEMQHTTTALTPFHFDAYEIRIHLDDRGEPWWEAQDVCAVLGIKNVGEAVARLKQGEKRSGNTANRLIINEKGLYRLIMRSNKPDAERFQDWLFGEVLPQIRKTGSYTAAPALPSEMLQTVAGLVQMFQGLAPAMQMIMGHAQQTDTRLAQHDATISTMDTRLKEVEARTESGSGYITLMAYARLKRFRLALSEARQHGMELRKRAKDAKVKLGDAPDERWGTVKTYPIDLLDEYFHPVIEAEKIVHTTAAHIRLVEEA